jgi:hypothetical protein
VFLAAEAPAERSEVFDPTQGAATAFTAVDNERDQDIAAPQDGEEATADESPAPDGSREDDGAADGGGAGA